MKRRIQTRVDVYLVILLALTLHIGLCSGTEPSTASGESTAELASILVLRDGGVLTGNVSRLDDGYLIHRGGTEIQVPTAKVLISCRTLAEGYEARRGEINPASADAHLSLAAWCMMHGLKPQAARELSDVRALEPAHPRLALLERRLAAAEPVATPNHSANQRLPSTPIATAPLDVREFHTSPLATETKLSGPVVERFTRKVQPILVNNCTTSGCHHRGGSEQFQLDRALLHGLANRRTTMQNLSATLALVDRQQPHLSPLLIVPRQTHGSMNAPLFGPRHTAVFNHLVEWVALVTQAEPTESAGLPTPQPDRDVALPNNSEQPPFMQNGSQSLSTTSIANLDQEPGSLRVKPLVRYGAQLQPWQPKDAFDPEIFNRQQRVQPPAEMGDSASEPLSPTSHP